MAWPEYVLLGLLLPFCGWVGVSIIKLHRDFVGLAAKGASDYIEHKAKLHALETACAKEQTNRDAMCEDRRRWIEGTSNGLTKVSDEVHKVAGDVEFIRGKMEGGGA